MRESRFFAGAVKLLAASTPDSLTLLREIVSFLNTEGGIISFRPKGPSMDSASVHRAICSGIGPDPAPYIRVETDADGRQRVEIAPGRRRPYYVRKEGMCPEGVFVRAEGRAVSSGALTTARMNRETYGNVYEKMRALRQDLTFREAGAVFAHSGCPLTPSSFPSLGITDPEDGEFTNLGYILSDQCPHSIVLRCFGDLRSSEPVSVREIRGSALRQYVLAAQWLDLFPQIEKGGQECDASLRRDAQPGYAEVFPSGALREALRNVIVHRDYSIEGSSFIHLDHTGMEFIATGGLIASLMPEQTTDAATLRNPGLMHVLCMLTDTPEPAVHRLLSPYEGTGRDPVIDVTPHSFSMYLPSLRPQQRRTQTA